MDKRIIVSVHGVSDQNAELVKEELAIFLGENGFGRGQVILECLVSGVTSNIGRYITINHDPNHHNRAVIMSLAKHLYEKIKDVRLIYANIFMPE